MSKLSQLSVGEVEDLLINRVDEEGDPIRYPITRWSEYSKKNWTWHLQANSWGCWGELDGFLLIDGLGRVEVISADTGGEGASDLEIVWRITSLEDGSTRLFKKTGCWVSHDGAYWDGDFSETSQKQKVVTYYE